MTHCAALNDPDLSPVGTGRTSLGWSLAAAVPVTGVFLLSNSVTPLYAHWQAAWGFGSGTVTVVYAAYVVGLIVTLVVAGRLADRYGRKAVLVPGVVAAIVAAALFLGAQNVVWLLVARVLAGVAVGATVTAGLAAIVDLAPDRHKRRASLISSVAMVFGAGLGPLLAGGIAATGLRVPQVPIFSVVAGIEVIAVIIVLVLPAPRPHASTTGRVLNWPSAPRANRRELRWGIGAFGAGVTAVSFVLSLGPAVLSGVGLGGPFVASAVTCAMFLVATGVQFVFARLSTRTHLALSSVAAIVAMIALVVATTVLPSPVLVIGAALLTGAAQGLGQLAGLSLIATRVPAARRAESNAVLNIGGYIPAGVLSVLAGYAADSLGLPAAVILFGAVLGAVAITALVTTAVSTGRDLAQAGPDRD